MRYRKLKVLKYCKLRKMTRQTRQIFPPNRIRDGWCENCQTCKIANLQFRWARHWRIDDHQCKRCWRIWKLQETYFCFTWYVRCSDWTRDATKVKHEAEFWGLPRMGIECVEDCWENHAGLHEKLSLTTFASKGTSPGREQPQSG